MSDTFPYALGLPSLPAAFFMTDEKRCPDPAEVIETLPEDCGVIFRDYQHPGREQLAFSLAELCRKKGLIFLVAGDPVLARKAGADGLHLPEWALMRHPGTTGLADRQILTVSAHGVRALRRAVAIGADAALVAPAFETISHKGRSGLGIHRLQRLAAASLLPFYVLGGITAQTIKCLPPLKKMAGIAGISLFMK